MRISMGIGGAYYDGSDWEDLVEVVRAADRLGVDDAWSAEAWGMETIAPLAYLAPLTERIRLGTGIMQITARVPAMTAMTALTMARLTGDRFVREYVAVVRQALRGERITFSGEHHVLPRPGGEGKALRLSMPPKPQLPIYLATLGPKALELTGEVADGWLGTSFIPEAADEVLRHLRTGAERAGRSMADIDLQVGGALEVGDDVERLIDKHRPGLAFTLGAMGSATTNFYNAAYRRAGWADVAEEVQRLWVAGDKEAAVRAVPDEFVLATTLVGTDAMVRERIRTYAAAGITTLRIGLQGQTTADRIANLERTVDVVRGATAAG
jgi:alkanesulfonate monooxygenase SsuD/methylene tetrahydromethanopterin reductase-like flavin-dependent oxidoreductase (luciferase family)